MKDMLLEELDTVIVFTVVFMPDLSFQGLDSGLRFLQSLVQLQFIRI